MLSKEIVIDQITILEDGQMWIRRATRVMEDGVNIGKTYHRHVVSPGQDVRDEDPRVRAVAELLHTPEVIAAYEANKATLPVLPAADVD